MVKKNTKHALLMSVLSLLLCCSMLIGTTFAWFTDEVKSGVNKITAGNLDVEVYYGKDAKPEKDKVTNTTENLFTDVNGQPVLWEPGVVAYTNLNVVNEGTLELKYQFAINFENENFILGTGAKLSQVLKVAFLENPVSGTREEILAAAKGQGVLLSSLLKSGTLAADGNKVYGVVIYWEPCAQDNNWNVQNGAQTNDGEALHIDLGLKLIATQKDAEQDSFGNDYDKTASVSVAPGESIAQAIRDVEDGGIVFLEPGVHNVPSGPIEIVNKKVSIIGLGDVTINKNYGSTHIFTIKNGAEVVFENINMDGKGNTREGVYVRWDCKVTLKDCSIKNTGGLDIMIDEASDAGHGEETASYVNLINTDVEDVAMVASPASTVPAATQDTYVYFNYDRNSAVGAIDVQEWNISPENVIINGVPSTEAGKTMQLYASNDAELAEVLNTIKTNENYWNKNVVVYLAAGEYSGDHVINQYPQWNGTVGAGGSGNNYATGVPAGAPDTVITFVGEAASTYSMRAAAAPTVVFTGNVTVNGFGNSNTGFSTAFATTTFRNVAFNGANSVEANGVDKIVVYLTAAAHNVTFEGCTFENATHVTLGSGKNPNCAGRVDVVGCTFNDGGCLSGYVETLNVSDTKVTAAKNGFIDKKRMGAVTVDNCDVVCDIYFLRTDNFGITVEVTDTTVKQTDVPNSKGTGLVVFRGSGHTVEFVDCDLTYDTLKSGAGTGELNITNFVDKDGVTYAEDGVTGEQMLYLVPSDYEGDTVNVAEGTTAIGNLAFAYNSNVKTVVLASTVRDLGRGFDSSSVEKVVLNEGLTTISSRAFKSTTALKEVVIPSTVTEIADNAFQKSGIKEIVIPANVKTIGETAFGASLIEKVTFEGDIDIQGYAFRGCPNLRTVVMKGYDVNFVKSTLNGRNSTWFCNSESNNPNVSDIDFYVKNEVIKERVLVAMGAERNNTDVYCEQTAATDENGESLGYYTDDAGNAYVYDDTGLTNALKNGEDIVLSVDVDTEAGTTAPYGNKYAFKQDGGVIDGNGKELYMECYGDDYGIMTSGGTIKNLTIQEGCRAIMIMYPTKDIIIDNVNIGGDGVLYPINTGESGNGGIKVIVTNSTLAGWTSLGDAVSSASFTNVKFEQGTYYNNIYGRVLKPYVNTTLTNCEFVAHMNLDLSALKAGHKVTITNCTVNGQPVTADVFTVPTTDAEYDTELFTIDLPSWANSIADCISFE